MSGKHEKTDMDPRYVLYFASGLTVAVLIIYLGVWWIFRQFERLQSAENRPASVEVAPPKPQPSLQLSPQSDLEQLRRQEAEILSTYRWVDRDKQIARIPIDRAMQVFLERQKK